MIRLRNEDRLQPFQNIIKDYIIYKPRQKNIFLPGYVNASRGRTEGRKQLDSSPALCATHTCFNKRCFCGKSERFSRRENGGHIVAFLVPGTTLAVFCVQTRKVAELMDSIVAQVSLYMGENMTGCVNQYGRLVR